MRDEFSTPISRKLKGVVRLLIGFGHVAYPTIGIRNNVIVSRVMNGHFVLFSVHFFPRALRDLHGPLSKVVLPVENLGGVDAVQTGKFNRFIMLFRGFYRTFIRDCVILIVSF